MDEKHIIDLANGVRDVFINEQDAELVFIITLKMAVQTAVDMGLDQDEFLQACFTSYRMAKLMEDRGDVH